MKTKTYVFKRVGVKRDYYKSVYYDKGLTDNYWTRNLEHAERYTEQQYKENNPHRNKKVGKYVRVKA